MRPSCFGVYVCTQEPKPCSADQSARATPTFRDPVALLVDETGDDGTQRDFSCCFSDALDTCMLG